MPDRDFGLKRRHPRKSYLNCIVFTHKERTYNGTIQNISLGGAFITTSQVNQFTVGDIITVTIPYRNSDKTLIRKCCIKWQNDEGFAIEFQ